jgi:hypothetical protein
MIFNESFRLVYLIFIWLLWLTRMTMRGGAASAGSVAAEDQVE